MPTILGVNFGRDLFGGPETMEKQGRKFRRKISPSKFAEKFAGNFLKFAGPTKTSHPKSAPNLLKISSRNRSNFKSLAGLI